VNIHVTYTKAQNYEQIPVIDVPKADYEQRIQGAFNSICSSVKPYNANDYVAVPNDKFVELVRGTIAVRTLGNETELEFKFGLLESGLYSQSPPDLFEVIRAGEIGQVGSADFGLGLDGSLVRKIGSKAYGLGNFTKLHNLSFDEDPRSFFRQFDTAIGPGFGHLMNLLGFPALMEQIQTKGLREKFVRKLP